MIFIDSLGNLCASAVKIHTIQITTLAFKAKWFHDPSQRP